MYEYVIQDIEILINDTFKEKKPIQLDSLVSTIDFKHKLVPSKQEINSALEKIAKYEIERKDEKVFIRSSKASSTEKITQRDMDNVHQESQKNLVNIISKLQDNEESKESIREFLENIETRKQ